MASKQVGNAQDRKITWFQIAIDSPVIQAGGWPTGRMVAEVVIRGMARGGGGWEERKQ